MQHSLIRSFLLVTLVASGPVARADSVHLKNGYILHGKIDDAKSDDNQLVVSYGELGFLRLGRDRVLKIEKNNRNGLPQAGPVVTATPAVTSNRVQVRLHQGVVLGDHDPSAQLIGHLKPSPDDAYRILEIPGLGTMQIPRAAIAAVEPYKSRATVAPVAASASSIATTHVVLMKNGRKILGSVLPGPESEPVVVLIGDLGRLTLPRERIDKIEKTAGRYELPPPTPPSQTSDSGATPAIDAAPDAAGTQPAAGTVNGDDPVVEIVTTDPELESEILGHLQDLSRWRSRNRVRGENHLRAIGSPAVPYLYEVSRHPFELTRRAVLRLVRDVGDPAGIPLALEALVDEDRFVRSLAHEALRGLLSVDLGYNPQGSIRRRLEAQKRWQDYYEKLLVARS